MTDAKKDIIIQVEIASNIYTEIDKLKAELANIVPKTGGIPVKIDVTGMKTQDWSKIVPPQQVVNIRSAIDKGFHLNIKNVKQALRSLHTDATIPITIAPISGDALAGMTSTDWSKLAPPDTIVDKIKKLNSALTTLGSRLNARKFGKGSGAVTKSLAEIINDTAAAFDRMAASAASAAGAVGAVKTHGIASDPTKTRAGGGKKKEFDRSLYTFEELSVLDEATLANPRQAAEYQAALAANAKLRARNELAGPLAKNNVSGMMDMGGLKGAMSRVLLFGSATSALYGGVASIRKAIDVTIDLENEMVQLKKVMDDTTPFEEMKKQMFDLSETMGVSILQTTKLAKIWAQQGYDMVGVMKLASVTLDTMNSLNVDAAVATDFLTSVTRVWGVELDELQKVLASVMRVQADYAIESEDLAAILTKIGSGVREAGDSMAFLAGASTALRESTRKTASQIFTSLKTIYAKSFSTEVIKSLQSVGVYAKSSADTFRPFSDVLTELAGKWELLSDVERKSLAITIGQTRYWSDFVALMENFNTVQSATLSFYRAWDDASKASQLQQQSLLNTLKGVGTSLSKIGDTFGNNFFTPLVKTLSGPIKGFADIFSKLAGAQGALVFAASLAILRSALKSVFGVFPAYEKFLGRAGLAGVGFTKSVINQRAAIMNSISSGTSFGGVIRYIANSMQLLTGKAGTATKSVLAISVAMTRLKAVTALVANGFISIIGSFTSFALWTAAFYAFEKALSGIIGLFDKGKTSAKEFIESLPIDVLEKIGSLGRTDQTTKSKVSSFSDIKDALDILLPKLIEKQKELTQGAKLHTLSWKEVNEVVNTLDTKTVATLRNNYGDLNDPIADHIKLWEDLQTTVAITQNLIYSGTIKKANELKTSLSEIFSQASSGSAEIYAIFKRTTGLSDEDIVDHHKMATALNKNMDKLINDPEFISAASKFSKGFGLKADLGKRLANIKGLGVNVDPKGIAQDVGSAIGFSLLSGRDQGLIMLQRHPLDLSMAQISGIDVAAFDNHLDLVRKSANKLYEGLSVVTDQTDKKLNEYTKMTDINNLKISTEGDKTGLGELFAESSEKARKALTALNSDLNRIKLLYRSGGIFPEDVLQEQQKAYKNFQTEIVSEYQAANDELASLSKKRSDIIATIMADPSRPKEFDPKREDFEDYITHLENIYNSAANEGEKAAADDNPILAHNLKLLKQTLQAQKDGAKNAAELADAYNKLGVVNTILGKINYQLEQQAAIEKIIKSNREFTAKQSIEFLKNEAKLQEDIAQTIISSERNILESYGNQFGKIEQLKEKELKLHRRVALRKSEIDIIEQKKALRNSEKILPSMLPVKGFAGLSQLWNAGIEARRLDLESQLDVLDEQGEKLKVDINLQQDMEDSASRVANFYSIWVDRLNSVAERSSFIRTTLAESITDFARINETHGFSVLTDTIGKIGKRFQEEQAKIFVNSVINSKLGGFVLPSEEDIKFTERLAATKTAFYESVYGAMHQGAIEISQAMGVPFVTPPKEVLDRGKAELEATNLGDIKKAGNIAAIGNLMSSIGLSFIGGNDANKQQGSQIGSIVGAMLPKLLLGANPVTGAIASVVGMFGGGVLGSLFGGKSEKQQDTMIGQLKLIEQNTARVADLTEKLVNIPGSVFLPPTGGFVMNGSIVINANGISNPQQVVDMTVNQLSREFGLSARRSGSRGYF